jgi:hypothetical protein
MSRYRCPLQDVLLSFKFCGSPVLHFAVYFIHFKFSCFSVIPPKKNPPPQLLRKRTSQKPITSLYRRRGGRDKVILFCPVGARHSVEVLERPAMTRLESLWKFWQGLKRSTEIVNAKVTPVSVFLAF